MRESFVVADVHARGKFTSQVGDMAGLKSIAIDVQGAKDLALISADNSVWIVVYLHWWDLATWLWWFLTPYDARSIIRLSLTNGQTVRTMAVRVASRYIKIGKEG